MKKHTEDFKQEAVRIAPNLLDGDFAADVPNRFRLNRGGNRQANAALYRVAIVRMRNHKPTLAYVSKRKKEGKSNREIIRCLKRYIVREIFSSLCRPDIPPAIG